MTLDVDAAASFLLGEGLITAADVVSGDLLVEAVWRRNRNLRITRRSGQGYLLKQPEPGGEASEQTLAMEICFYQLCQEEEMASVAALVPRLCHCDQDEKRLVLELLEDVHSLHDEYRRHPVQRIPASVFRALGRALGTVHCSLQRPPQSADLPSSPPWIFAVHRPSPGLLSRLTLAHRRALHIVQTDEQLNIQLENLLSWWRCQSLIHGDVRADNVLVCPGSAGGDPDLYLIDWELAQWGDPAWDVAGVLQDIVLYWISRMPADSGLTATERVARAEVPWRILQAGAAAFWWSYLKTVIDWVGQTKLWADANSGLARLAATREAPSPVAEFLSRSVAFSAARLVQSAIESAQVTEGLPASSVLMLQIAANILKSPRQAAAGLYGLSVPSMTPS